MMSKDLIYDYDITGLIYICLYAGFLLMLECIISKVIVKPITDLKIRISKPMRRKADSASK